MGQRASTESRPADRDAGVNGRTGNADPEEDPSPLPPLEEAIHKIPPATRQKLDELFRGKFIAVKRIRKEDLY